MSTILIVDDELGLAEMSGEILSALGHDVVSAANGKIALAALETSRPDVILLDLMMPIMSGAEVLQVLKRNHQTRHIPVIMMSAAGKEAVPPELRDHMVGFLAKPFTFDQLMAAVGKCLPKI
jgi:twitching motility two-component system response regulator PilH